MLSKKKTWNNQRKDLRKWELTNYLKEYESVTSPTIALESLFTTLLVDAYEEREVATFDVLGAYLHARLSKDGNKERLLLNLAGDDVDIICEVSPEHSKHVVYENGKKVLYLLILRAIYGCIKSALWWHELYSTTFEKEGYIVNLYKKCVTNKKIKGAQCTTV